MSFEIRPVHNEEIEEFRNAAATSLVMKPAAFAGMQPEWTLCGFENSKLVTAFAAWPLTMRLNGKGTAVSGVTSVGTKPAYHRRGYLKKIMTKHFELMHEEGQRSIATLWASWAAIYQRYGYGIVSFSHRYAVEPRYIQFANTQKLKGSLQEIEEHEIDVVKDIYRRFIEDRTGYIHRSKLTWDMGVMSNPSAGGSLNKIIYKENDEPLGYIIFEQKPQPSDTFPAHRLLIRDLAWLNITAYRAIWENLSTMDLIGEIIWQRTPSDDPLPYLLMEPRRLRATTVDGLLARIVDVKKALLQRGYQENGELTFKLVDNLCSWNEGTWKLTVSKEGSEIFPTHQSPELTIPVSTLSLLMFGQITASEAARMGRLDVHVDNSLPVWDKIMRSLYRPACADEF